METSLSTAVCALLLTKLIEGFVRFFFFKCIILPFQSICGVQASLELQRLIHSLCKDWYSQVHGASGGFIQVAD